MTGEVNATIQISFFNSSNPRTAPINSAILMQEILGSSFEVLAHVNDFLSMAVDMRSYEVIQLLLNKYHTSPEMANTPDEHGVTLIQRWARDADLKILNLFFRAMDKNQILINPQAFYSREVNEGCWASSQISEIDGISLEELEDVFVGQKFCNAIVITTSKEKHILQNTHIDSVMARISERFGEKPDRSGDEVTAYFGPRHFSMGVECVSCGEQGEAVHETVGFCPTGEPAERPITGTRGSNLGGINSREISTTFLDQYCQVVDDTSYKIESKDKNYLRIPIRMRNTTRAKSFWRHVQELKRDCVMKKRIYNAFEGPNCVDETEEVFIKAGIPGFQMLSTEDLTMNGFNLEFRALGYAHAKNQGLISAVPIVEYSVLIGLPLATIGLLMVGYKLTKKIISSSINGFLWIKNLYTQRMDL